MFGLDGTVRGQEAVLDVGQHCVRPAEGRVARCGAIGAGDVSLMENVRLPSLTTVVPAAIPAHSRLVSPVWNPRTTWRRACSGRPSVEVSTAMIKGV
jgi:hypothetical protein